MKQIVSGEWTTAALRKFEDMIAVILGLGKDSLIDFTVKPTDTTVSGIVGMTVWGEVMVYGRPCMVDSQFMLERDSGGFVIFQSVWIRVENDMYEGYYDNDLGIWKFHDENVWYAGHGLHDRWTEPYFASHIGPTHGLCYYI